MKEEKDHDFNWWEGDPRFEIDKRVYIPVNYSMKPKFDVQVIEKTDRYEIYRDNLGILHKALIEGTVNNQRNCMDQYLAFPVEKPEDFKEIKKRFVFDWSRYPQDWESRIDEWKNCEYPLILAYNCQTCGCYWRMREWLGTERLSYWWYDEPETCEEMCEWLMDFTIETSKSILSKGIDIDYVMINEDMSMKTGPLLSPATYKRYIAPYFRKLVDYLKSHGVRYVFVDTDGNCEKLLPALIECGVDGIWPLERVCGMDPVRLRKEYGTDLKLFGGVDKIRIARGPAEIDRHLAELVPLIEQGGYIPTIDHTVPPEVSLKDFDYYIKRKQDLLSGHF